MHGASDKKKILRILVKQNMNRKIARLLSKNCRTNSSSTIGPPARIEPTSFAREHNSIPVGRPVVDDHFHSRLRHI